MKKRKIIVILLALSMVLSTFFGCATENNQGSNTNVALDGNASQNTTSTAFSSGIGNTSSNFDETAYVGTWSTSGTNWINGGMILDISVSGDNVVCKFYCYERAPECYMASFSYAVHQSVIVDNQAELFFSDDGWGNTGNVTVLFKTNEIVLTFSDVHDGEGLGLEGMWGFRNGSYTLTYDPNAMDAVTYTMDEYYELFPEYDPNYNPGHNPTPDSSPTFLYTHSGTISISTANISLQDSAVLYITVSYAGSVSYDCEQSDVITLSWGQFDSSNTVPLYITANKNGTAQIRIYETYFPDNYLTINVTVSGHASVDTSTASGILASMGMTEEQFRNNCIYIGSKYYTRNSYVYAAGREFYSAHPNENTLLDNYTEEWLDYCANGKKAESYDDYSAWYLDNSSCLDDYLDYKIYGPKGASILGKQAEEYLKAMREYPNEYINGLFLLKNFNVEYSSNYMYTNSSYVVYEMPVMVVDYRNDTNNPNVITGYYYYDMYVIFLGTYRTISGEVGLQFALISLDRSDEA